MMKEIVMVFDHGNMVYPNLKAMNPNRAGVPPCFGENVMNIFTSCTLQPPLPSILMQTQNQTSAIATDEIEKYDATTYMSAIYYSMRLRNPHTKWKAVSSGHHVFSCIWSTTIAEKLVCNREVSKCPGCEFYATGAWGHCHRPCRKISDCCILFL